MSRSVVALNPGKILMETISWHNSDWTRNVPSRGNGSTCWKCTVMSTAAVATKKKKNKKGRSEKKKKSKTQFTKLQT
jgi:hypothetical protein